MPPTEPPAEPPAEPVTVERVPPELTHDLRQRVLRPGRPPGAARFPADAHPEAAAFAARDAGGAVVGTALIYPEACPWRPGQPGAWRLRGMATAPGRRGLGIGRRVLDAALAHVAAAGGHLAWCNARVPAQAFYERAGFRVHGERWDDPEIGPHVAMWRPLEATANGGAVTAL